MKRFCWKGEGGESGEGRRGREEKKVGNIIPDICTLALLTETLCKTPLDFLCSEEAMLPSSKAGLLGVKWFPLFWDW